MLRVLEVIWWAVFNLLWWIYLILLAIACLTGMVLVYNQHTNYELGWAITIGMVSGTILFAWAGMLSTNIVAAVFDSSEWLWRRMGGGLLP